MLYNQCTWFSLFLSLGVSCGFFFCFCPLRCLGWLPLWWAGLFCRAAVRACVLRLGGCPVVWFCCCRRSVRCCCCSSGWGECVCPPGGGVLVGVCPGLPGLAAVRALPRFGGRGARCGRFSACVLRAGWGALMVAGFCGSRSLSVSFRPVVAAVVSAVAAGGPVAVGCAPGADALVRSLCPSAVVWSAASFGSGPGSFAARSSALVRSLAAVPGSSLVGFVSSACPAGVVPAASWRSGRPASGSWSSLALAVGLGVGVGVVWCGAGSPVLPAWAGGVWVAGVAGGVAVWSWVPAALQPQLI